MLKNIKTTSEDKRYTLLPEFWEAEYFLSNESVTKTINFKKRIVNVILKNISA